MGKELRTTKIVTYQRVRALRKKDFTTCQDLIMNIAKYNNIISIFSQMTKKFDGQMNEL